MKPNARAVTAFAVSAVMAQISPPSSLEVFFVADRLRVVCRGRRPRRECLAPDDRLEAYPTLIRELAADVERETGTKYASARPIIDVLAVELVR